MPVQINNKAHRDVIGVQNIINIQTPMTALIAQFHEECANDPVLNVFIEQLQHYLSNETVSDVRGLEDKLIASNREDQIEDAILKKHNAAKFILKNQSSKATQNIMAHILADMAVNFDYAVKPLVQSGESRQVIDSAILEKVIGPCYQSLESNPLGFHKGHIQEFLYFLAGNCHVRWDAC